MEEESPAVVTSVPETPKTTPRVVSVTIVPVPAPSDPEVGDIDATAIARENIRKWKIPKLLLLPLPSPEPMETTPEPPAEAHRPVSPRPGTSRQSEELEVPLADSPPRAYISQPLLESPAPMVCYNCRGDHHYNRCQAPFRNLFCKACGHPGVSKATCPVHRVGYRRAGPFIRPLNRNVPWSITLTPEERMRVRQDREHQERNQRRAEEKRRRAMEEERERQRNERVRQQREARWEEELREFFRWRSQRYGLRRGGSRMGGQKKREPRGGDRQWRR